MSKNPPDTHKATYKLDEIVLWPENKHVNLPSVQRGFVWKPSQIENLWDSLLRGFPIGSFVFGSNKENGGSSLQLLDGQQRATSICVGTHNPFEQNEQKTLFNSTSGNALLFIDLGHPPKDDTRHFVFRLITKSHPWGYRRKDNQKTLEAENVRKALDLFEVKTNYLNEPITSFWPYDAIRPIPFCFFVEAYKKNLDVEQLKHLIASWEEKHVKKGESKKEKDTQEFSINEIYERVRTLFGNFKIPALYLNLEHHFSGVTNLDSPQTITPKNISTTNEISKDEEEDDQEEMDEIENLFVRLNSGGTPLRGEELNYSILKAHIDILLQKELETHCEGLIRPSRFVTVAYRLFQHQTKSTEADPLTMRIKPKVFQKKIQNKIDKESFSNFLEKDILKSGFLEKIKSLLTFSTENPYGFPHLLVSSIGDTSPEVFFMLAYRLLIKRDKIIINSDLHRRMLGMLTLFSWLGKGERQKNHQQLLLNIWPVLKDFDTEQFWSSITIQRAQIKHRGSDILFQIPTFDKLKRIVKNDLINKNESDKRSGGFKNIEDDVFYQFIVHLFFNKELILYVQREALSIWYKPEHFLLEDTNRPFDWDHICPENFRRNRRGINQPIKDWFASNGNFRAWPYSLNRFDQDQSPAIKLAPSKIEDREQSKKTTNQLIDFFAKEFNLEVNGKGLEEKLLSWTGACKKDWLEFTSEDDLKENNSAKKLLKLILERNIEICRNWYESLLIDELLPEITKNKSPVSTVFIENKFEYHKKDEFYETLSQTSLSLWFQFDVGDDETNNFKYLKENAFSFGVMEKNGHSLLDKMCPKNLDDYKILEYENDIYYTNKSLTLTSFLEVSYEKLVKEIKTYLEGLNLCAEKDHLLELLKSALQSQFK